MHSINYISVEDFNEECDRKFITEYLNPYFKDLYNDLILRCVTPEAITERKLDKIIFLEYFNLPGILNDRLQKMFDTNKDELVTETSFIGNLIRIFASNLHSRL